MHRNIKQFIATSIFLILVVPASCYASDDTAVRKALEGMKIDSVKYIEGLEMYEVISNNTNAAYVTKDMRYLIAGRLFDMNTKRDLTTERIESLRRIDFSLLNLKSAIKMGTGSTSIAVFTDPGCGYCKKLHGELSRLKDVTFYIYLYPLAASSNEAKAKSAEIRCADDSLSALNAVFGKKPFKSTGKPTMDCIAMIEDNIRFGREHGINATPTIILPDGRVLTGYRSAADLITLIKGDKTK